VPPSLDIYALTRQRDRATIERFLDEYGDRVADEERGDEELMIESPAFFGEDWAAQPPVAIPETAYEWEPSRTLSHIIDRGLDYPRRAFTVYLTAKAPDVDRITLAFTRDDQLVVGLSIDDEGAQPENEVIAKALLGHLMEAYGCHAGLVIVETYPPQGEREFQARAQHPLTVFYTVPPATRHAANRSRITK
jgi:hypothetical protein